ncbi:hypothetical protein EG68_02535 [Paragonimus skrjabini miyazakii]|uniref:BHLH domain-containing protein n=1 Tax=Paragonimus skrjabini miyazakii TaxID=59628 RepID=A0A8S9Z3Z0_9TREM|nr:hypothetical protein EG68_02535 [Paragonimus skrjabini miyazakii]
MPWNSTGYARKLSIGVCGGRDLLGRLFLQKINAERHRRRSINIRLDHLRRLLRLDDQLTRIQVLEEAANRVKMVEPIHWDTHSTSFNHTIAAFNPSCETGAISPLRSNKARIEQHRRQLERYELNRVRTSLGTGKISDVCLLDKLIRRFEGKSAPLVPTPSISLSLDCFDRLHTPLTTPRKPLGSLDVNLFSKRGMMYPAESTNKRKLPTDGLSTECGRLTTKAAYWRPWEARLS